MQRYLVTGGAGFIGSHVVDALIAEGSKVKVLDNLVNGKRGHIHPEAEFIQGDVTEYETVLSAAKGVDGIFHLAALPRVPYSVQCPLESARVNIDGTLHVLEAARRAGVKRVVFSSTSAIYGNSRNAMQSVGDPIEPLSPYALQKYIGEQLAGQYSQLYGVESVCLRYFNVFGPRMDDEGGYGSVLAIFRKQKSAGKALTIEGDGAQGRDFVFVTDVARANMLAMTSSRVGKGEVLNIGTGHTYAVAEIARLFECPVEHVPARPNDVQSTKADIRRTTELLGWVPQVLFSEGVRQGILTE